MENLTTVSSANARRQALLAARGWIGTPYVLGAALRGAGCDCVGLIRGVWSDITGDPPPPPPPWRQDWANSNARPLVVAARKYLHPIPLDAAAPGDAVVLRLDGTRDAHCGILADDGNFIHALEDHGVVCVPFDAYRPGLSFAARFPAA